jgi:hypothetical protein
MTCKLWIDVEDLFEYARGNPRPSGIQRLAFEIYSAVSTLPNSNDFASFVRHDHTRTGFRIVPWEEIETLFYGMTNPKPAPIEPPLPPSSPEPPEPVLTTDSPPTPEPAIVESSAPQPDPTPHVSIWLRIARWLVARRHPTPEDPARCDYGVVGVFRDDLERCDLPLEEAVSEATPLARHRYSR